MNSQQLTPRNAHDAAPLDILRSPFYPFPELLDSSKVTQAPHSLQSYVQQQYAPESGAFLEGGESPPLPHHILEQHLQGYPSLDPPSVQQHQLYPTVTYPPFTHDHERPHPTPQGLSDQPSRASALSPRPTISPCPFPIAVFSDNASTQSTTLRGGPIHGPRYAPPHHWQPPYYPRPTHHSAPTGTHAPRLALEQPQPNMTPDTPTLHEQHEDREITITDQGHRSRPWGGVGSLDPATGVYCQVSDHHRIRTAQACEKCRTRKAKCSGEHPTCQRCFERKLECQYAAERRMRGPNKPKPLLSMPDGSPKPAVAEKQKPRKRASTMPTVQRRMQIWDQQQQQRQKQSYQHQEPAVIAASVAAASPASSAGSGSMGYPPLSESEASPMTPHSSLDSRHSTGVSFPDLSLPFDNLNTF